MIREFLLSGSISTTFLVAIVTGLVVYWLLQKWKYNYPPGPPGWPLIGNAFQSDLKILHEQAFEWSKKYGPVIRVRLGNMSIVFVNTIDSALEVLVKKSTDFASRMMTPSLDIFTYGGKDIAFSDYGPTWKLHRKIASKALRHYLQGEALERRLFDALETAFVEIDNVSGQFDPSLYINYIVTNILTGICFGGKYYFKDEEVSYLVKVRAEINEKFAAGILEDFVPGLKYVYKSQRFKELKELTKLMVEGFIRGKFKEAESTFNKENIRHFADNLILARMKAEEEDGKEALTEDHLVQTLSDIFFEKDRLPGVKDRPNLGYTEAVLHESMRLSTVLPTGLFHQASCDSEVSGYKIPKCTNKAINYWALHHDPSAWDDVDRFIPERFLGEDGKLGPKPKNWLPFSAGTRVCLGEFVAKPELHLIFASLMQRYKWRMVSGMCADINSVGSVFLLESKPYKLTVEKRI